MSTTAIVREEKSSLLSLFSLQREVALQSRFLFSVSCVALTFFVHVDFFELVIFALELRNEKNVGAKYKHTPSIYYAPLQTHFCQHS